MFRGIIRCTDIVTLGQHTSVSSNSRHYIFNPYFVKNKTLFTIKNNFFSYIAQTIKIWPGTPDCNFSPLLIGVDMPMFFPWHHPHFPPQKYPSEIPDEITKGLKPRKLVHGSKTRDKHTLAIDAQINNTQRLARPCTGANNTHVQTLCIPLHIPNRGCKKVLNRESNWQISSRHHKGKKQSKFQRASEHF